MLDLLLITFQIITVNQTTPCFLNFTAGAEMWQNCGADVDFLQFMLLPWEWISGGYFSLVFASLLILFTYIKYHKAIYPIMIGLVMIPISFWLFPDPFITFAFILGVGLGGAGYLIYMLTRQTRD